MKLFIYVAVFTFSVLAQAAEPVLLWDCRASTDPDFTHAKIYQADGVILARLVQESGDGDERDRDLVQLSEVAFGPDSFYTYEQEPRTRPVNGAILPNPSRKTRELMIQISKVNGSARILASAGPTGDVVMDEDARCTKP